MQRIFDKVSRVFFCLIALFLLVLLSGCAQKPLVVNSVKVSETRVELGFEYLSINEFDLAESNFKRALQFDKQNVYAILGLAIIAQSTDEFDLAENYYEQALKIAPNDVFLLNNYGAFSCYLGQYMRTKSEVDHDKLSQQAVYSTAVETEAGCDIDYLKNVKSVEYQQQK